MTKRTLSTIKIVIAKEDDVVTRTMTCDDKELYMDRMPIDNYIDLRDAAMDAISIIENYVSSQGCSMSHKCLNIGEHCGDAAKDRKNIRSFFKLFSVKLALNKLQFRFELLKIRTKNKLLRFKASSFFKLTKS